MTGKKHAVNEADATIPANTQEPVTPVDPREIDVNGVDDVERLKGIALALQEHCAELGAHMASAIRERDELRAGGLSDVPAFRLGPPEKLLSEMTHEELLAEARRYQHVEKLLNEENQTLLARLEGAVMFVEGASGEVALEGRPDWLGLGERLEIPVVVKRSLPRADLSSYEVGQVVGVVTLAPGWGLHTLVDHIRDGWCGEGA